VVREAADIVHGSSSAGPSAVDGRPRTFGTGFETRVAIPLAQPLPPEARQLLPYEGPLASAITVDADGTSWLLLGFVPVDVLRRDAANV
jgi:hypothetical protein